MEQLKTRDDVLGKLQAYTITPDDNVIVFKEKIKQKLLTCPELLYALNNKELEGELFDKKGNLRATYNENGIIEPEGEWDLYYNRSIRPHIMYIEEVQSETNNFLCYEVSFNKIPKYNQTLCKMLIEFDALICLTDKQAIDAETGIPRHDLIGSIIRENFNWSNIFGTQCEMISNVAKTIHPKYISRQIIFECTLPNGITQTPYGEEQSWVINRLPVRR